MNNDNAIIMQHLGLTDFTYGMFILRNAGTCTCVSGYNLKAVTVKVSFLPVAVAVVRVIPNIDNIDVISNTILIYVIHFFCALKHGDLHVPLCWNEPVSAPVMIAQRICGNPTGSYM